MAAIADTRKPRGRPPTYGVGVHVKLYPDDLAALDAWIEQQDSPPSRPEAIRLILREKLA